MNWDEMYGEDNQPTAKNIDEFIHSSLWAEMNDFLQQTYKVLPQTAYSRCSAQRGWNVKYKKGGKSLCTLYPMDGYFIALVVIGAKEDARAELQMPMCCEYTQKLYERTAFSMGGRWLMIDVTDRNILEDTKNLIKIRINPK